MELKWYYSIFWLDMLMHFLGGFWVALFIAFLLSYKKETSPDFSLKFFIKIIGGVLLVGILWELFEVSINSISVKETFDVADTLSDLFFDIVGSIIALFYIRIKRKRLV